jgi:hypothetical protein
VTFGTLLSMSAITVAVAGGWLVTAIAWMIVRRLDVPSPIRASLLAQTRLIPLACIVLLVPSQIRGFVRFEPEVSEAVGPLLALCSLGGLALAIGGCIRGWRSWMATRQIISSWRASATPLSIGSWRRRAWLIDRPFPVVAVVGVFRPELYVARSVAVECTPAELDAIAAHETAHIVAGDNLRRALFSLTPGARLASRLANAIEGEWSVAAEEAADAYARLSAPALDLASALTKVAGLAVGRDPEPLAGSPLIQQFALETRVRLLLDPPASSRRRLLASLPIAALFAAAILLQSAVVLSGLHELFELLVQR